MSNWLTLKEAAAHARVCPRTFARQVKIGRLPPACKIGRRVLWDRATLDAAIAGNMKAAGTPDAANVDPIMAAINAAKSAAPPVRRTVPRQSVHQVPTPRGRSKFS
jgi:predicted DNA-binding transcriptional regulator AlpA